MADVTWGFGIAVGSQVGYGTILAATRDLTGALTLTNGIVLGDADSGVGQSGVDIGFQRIQRELSPVSGSFTHQFPTRLRVDLEKLTVSVQLKGVGTSALSGLAAGSPVDGDMDLSVNYPGLNALLKASGLAGAAWGAGVGYTYVPGAVVPATIKVWRGSGSDAVAYVLQDCVCKPKFEFAPGDVAIATFEISGTFVTATGAITMPTFAFGAVASISAPILASGANSWGIGAAARGFSELAITIDNVIESVSNSNSATGFDQRQTGRRISAELVIHVDSADEAYEETRLNATSATTDDLTFSVWGPNGAAVVGGGEVKSFAVFLNNPNVVKTAVDKLGDAVAIKVEIEGTATTANGEFELRFI